MLTVFSILADYGSNRGLIPINVADAHVDALCFTGHKGLGGPGNWGIPGERFPGQSDDSPSGWGNGRLFPILYPYRNPAGSFRSRYLKPPGDLRPGQSFGIWKPWGFPKLKKWNGSSPVPFLVRPCHPQDWLSSAACGRRAAGVVSVSCPDRDLSEITCNTDRKYGIMTRLGLHCAPFPTGPAGSYPTGSLRFSFNHTTPWRRSPTPWMR